MAWSSAELSADELAWAAAGKPFFSSNALMTTPYATRWTQGYLGTFAIPDRTDSDYPISRAYDGKPSLITQADFTVAANHHSLLFDFSPTGIEFDWWGVIYHNHRSTLLNQVRLEIDNANTFATFTTLSIVTVSAFTEDVRYGSMAIYHTGSVARRYSNVEYIRIAMQSGGADTEPFIGQLILGRRRQQKFNPNGVWDPTNQSSPDLDFESHGGCVYRTARAQGRANIDATFLHESTAEQDDTTDWWADIEGGEQPFYYTQDASQSAGAMDFWMMFIPGESPSLEYPYINSTSRELRLEGVEQGPQGMYLSQE